MTVAPADSDSATTLACVALVMSRVGFCVASIIGIGWACGKSFFCLQEFSILSEFIQGIEPNRKSLDKDVIVYIQIKGYLHLCIPIRPHPLFLLLQLDLSTGKRYGNIKIE